MATKRFDEESRALLRRIVEANAWRQSLGANVLGHCLKMVGDREGKLGALAEATACLEFYGALEHLYRHLGGEDLDVAVRDRLLNVPMPQSRFELAMCRLLTDKAQRVALAAYRGSVCDSMAQVAVGHLERPAAVSEAERERMLAFATEAAHRPRAQQAFELWLGISLQALGRPGSRGDRRALELGLRERSTEELLLDYLGQAAEVAAWLGLAMPGPARLPVELPEGALVG